MNTTQPISIDRAADVRFVRGMGVDIKAKSQINVMWEIGSEQLFLGGTAAFEVVPCLSCLRFLLY
jgi:hypothetical protein